jgi:hypothetical protein
MSTTDEKKKKRALALLLFLPLASLRKEIAIGADRLEREFTSIFDEYEETASVAKAVQSGVSGLATVFTDLIASALSRGYRDAVNFTGAFDPKFKAGIDKLAQAEGSKVAKQMMKTTKGWMKANGSDGYTLSRDRAEAAIRYKAAEAYFNAVGAVFRTSDDDWEKEWNTTSDDPCDECLDNEDQGFISMLDEFQSGHFAPLAHLHCACFLRVRRAGTGD